MLNLDELIGAAKVVHWRGKDYPVKDVTLRVMLKAEKTMSEAKDAQDIWRGMTDTLKDVIPGLDVEAVPVTALEKLFSYALYGDADRPLAEKPVLEKPAGEGTI